MQRSTQRQILLFYFAITAGGCFGAEIEFKAQADIRGSLVLLGDVADVRDPDAKRVDELRRIELFPSPARGRTRVLREVELRQLLELHGVNTSEHQFSGAESIMIGHAKIIAMNQQPTLQPSTTGTTTTGTTSTGTTSTGTQTPEEIAVVVAKRAIGVGDILRPVDLEMKSVLKKPSLTASAATTPEAVIGKEMTRSVAAGQPIDTRALRKPILVQRGEEIVVTAKAAGVRVQMSVTALADGSLGDLVPVQNWEKKRETFSAVVTGIRQAEIFARGPSVTESSPPTQSIRASLRDPS